MSSDSKPIDLNHFKLAILDLGDSNLISLKLQLENSISKLTETKTILDEEIKIIMEKLKENTDNHNLNDDLELYKSTISENDLVLSNQNERLITLNNELISRGLLKSDPKDKTDESKSNDNYSDEGIYL